MSDQEQQLTDTTVSSENPLIISNDENPSSDATEKPKENELNPSESAQPVTRRITMPQDVRYSTEPNDRDKLIEKYNNYQVSDTNACDIRFLTDNRQKKNLLGRHEEENFNLHSLAKTFNVNMFPGYQQPTKHSYKIFGTEANVRKCLVETMNRMFKRSNRPIQRDHNESNNPQTKSQGTEVSTEKEIDDQTSPPTSIFVTTINPDSSITEESKPITSESEKPQQTEKEQVDDKSPQDPASIFVTTINPDSSITEESKSMTSESEKPQETEKEKVDDKSPPDPASIFVTTINPDSSITEEQKPITPTTPNTNDDNNETKDETIEQEQLKFIPLERKPQFTFIMLVSNQGQEVLKKNWNFFAGSLQQRLNIVVTNPVKLPKFGDKQVHNELSITGELIENLTDATLQIAAFINDVLGVPIQPYKADEDSINNDNNYHQRQKNDNHSSRSYPGQSSSFNNYHGRTFFNRNRNGAFEQVILVRSDCVARIVGIRGSNLKRIQNKCHLRDIIVGRQANENGYVECTLSAYQARNLHFAIDTIRNFLRNEDDTAVLVIESNPDDNSLQNPPDLRELVPPDTEHTSATSSSSELRQLNEETGFMTKPLNLGNSNSYPQPSYNFQNTPSFDFTHQATSASRKTDKRRGDLNDNNKTPNEPQNSQYENFPSSNYLSNSPRHKSKRSCPETKEIDCTTDDGFWIHKQYYHALDETSKQLFDSLIDKLEKIRIATEENAARKQQRLVGRNRCNKSRVYTSSISFLNEDNNQDEKDLIIKSTQIENNAKVEQSIDVNEEKENKQETTAVVVNQD